LGATGGELALYDEQLQVIRIVISHNLEGDHRGKIQEIGEGLMGQVAMTREPVVIEDYSAWGEKLPGYENIQSTIGVPLVVGQKLVGVFTVANNQIVDYSDDDLYLLKLFSQQAAIAIQNASLLDQAQEEIQTRIDIQAEITRQKEYYEALLINNPVAVVTGDLNGSIISWNPSAEELFGYKFEEVVGKPLDNFVARSDSQYEEAQQYTREVIEKGHVHTTTQRTRKDGSAIDVELLALPVVVADETIGFIVIYHDLTEIKNIENALRVQNEKMVRELELAGEIQTSYLPRRLPTIGGWQFESLLKPSRETSGDFFDVHKVSEGRIAVLIADVVDKGVGAALFMSLCWTLLRTFSSSHYSEPDRVMAMVNGRILEDTKSGQFMSLFYGVLEPTSGRFVYANAGHPPPYLCASLPNHPIVPLSRTGIPLGVSKNENWKTEIIEISPGDAVCLYTDGITEAMNEQGIIYGEKRLKDVLMVKTGVSAEEMCSSVMKDLEEFVGAEAQSDDIAMIVVKREL
jgi:PAS domain S-box-containing protein